MKKIVGCVLLLCGLAYADQFNVQGRDLVRPDANGASLAFGAGEIIAFSSYATASVAQVYPEKYAKIPVMLASSGQADSLYASSTSLLDTQNIRVDGLDENWDRQIKITALTGSNRVRVGGSGVYWRRVNEVSVAAPARGVVRVNSGVSSFNHDSTKTVAHIRIGQSTSQVALFSTWRNFQGSIQSWSMDLLRRGTGGNPDSTWGVGGILARTQSDTSWKILYSRGIQQGENIDVQFVQTIPLLPQMDVYVALGVTHASTEVVTNLGIGGQ